MIAVVTGAAQGLGAAFTRALADAGYTVATCDIVPGCDAQLDVRDAQAVKQWIDEVVTRYGRVDVAVANAGVARLTSPLGDWADAVAEYDEVVGTNLAGVYWLGRAVAPVMVQQGSGHIVVISTDHVTPPPGRGTGGGAHMDLYDASKWALRGLVEAWSKLLGRHGVRVNALCMGATDTAMLRGFLGDRATPEVVAGWMRPAEVADALLELPASDCTGEHIPIWAPADRP
jgi:NAD(P)-dependent dehydrogenase (short-subunit alcohol dehydrogenase family)